MDKSINTAFIYLVKALKYTRDHNVKAIHACMNTDKDGYQKEVAEIEYEDGHTLYADIGGDANTTAMYDVLAVLCGLKKSSSNIHDVKRIAEGGQFNGTL